MASFGTTEIGDLDDRVRLVLGDEEPRVIESYEVKSSVLTQPAAFSLRLGHGGVARELLQRYPPKTPFKLFIGDVLQQTGETDGRPRAEGSTGATELVIRGRDSLAPLHDGFVDSERSYADETYSGLVRKVLAEVGLGDRRLHASGNADRRMKAGVPVVELAPPRTVDEIMQDASSGAATVGVVRQVLQAKLGERWHEFVRRHIDRAGLFLWAAADGSFILSEPNWRQKPTYRITRRRGQARNQVNVTRAEYEDSTVPRYSGVVIYGRGGGRKFGRAKSKAAYLDDEMINWGYRRLLVLRDANVQTIAQAEYLGRRKIAEGRRAGWQLVYTLSGHTLPSLVGGGRAVVVPDTIAEVDDDEFGLYGIFYVEGVEYRRQPQTETTVRLMRTDDLVFGSDD